MKRSHRAASRGTFDLNVMSLIDLVFLLLEDEYGLVNVLVSKELVERERDVVRTAAFVRVRGRLDERAVAQRTLIAESVSDLRAADGMAMPEGKSWG